MRYRPSQRDSERGTPDRGVGLMHLRVQQQCARDTA